MRMSLLGELSMCGLGGIYALGLDHMTAKAHGQTPTARDGTKIETTHSKVLAGASAQSPGLTYHEH